VGDTRGIFTLPVIWDLIEESPVFSDSERVEISRFVWEYANKCPGANQSVDIVATPHGNNWNSRANWWAATYFRRYYGIDVAGLEAWCDNWFATQMQSWKPAEDCPGYGSITWYDLMCYLLEKPEYEQYQLSGNLRKMADYAMTITNNLGYISGFGDISSFTTGSHVPGLLLITGWLERDGRYLWFYDQTPGVPPTSADYFGNHYFVADIEPEEPVDLLGIRAFELAPWLHEHGSEVLVAASQDVTAVLESQPVPEFEKCFDKISFRDGFSPDDEYLLLGGISHGYHAHPDGNSIIGFTDNGKYWLFDNGYFVPDTIEHNTICVFRDGLFEPVPRYTSLEASADFSDVGMTQTQCAGYNGVDWRRNILWRKNAYFAVVDELEAVEDGDFSFQSIWRTMGKVDLRPDRMLVEQGGERFCLINANEARLATRATTPPAADRHALIETCPAQLIAGESAGILNLFYSPNVDGYPYDAARWGDMTLLVREPGRTVIIAAGEFDADGVTAVAELAYLSRDEAYLLEGTSLAWGEKLLESDVPVDAFCDWAKGEATIIASAQAKVGLRIGQDQALRVDGAKRQPGAPGADGLTAIALEPGEHLIEFTASEADGPSEADLGARFDALKTAHEERLATAAGAPAAQLEVLWSADHAVTETRSIFRPVGGEGTETEPNLAAAGQAMSWEAGSSGSGPPRATDGDMETYAAVSSTANHAMDVPKDLGIQWPSPQVVSQVWAHHYSEMYRPALDGQDLQSWDGEQWVSIDDAITGIDGATWVHTFDPVTTSRVRLRVTEFDTARTAIREFAVFERPVEQVDVDVVRTRVPGPLAVVDVDGDGVDEVAVAVEDTVRLHDGAGTLVWEHVMEARAVALAAGDLSGPSIVASTSSRKMLCLDGSGGVLWTIDSPKDRYVPEIEPAPGNFTVLQVDDIDGDGDGEVVAGNSNWFAYAFDHAGQQLWGTLNWAHPALSIALGDLMGDGKLAALIGTRYNDAGLFQWDGQKIGALGMGYHSSPCATELADLDGDAKMELIGGSRIGGVHAKAFGGDALWALDMGAEVRETVAADLTGDGLPEVLVGSRNCYVLCLDAAGEVLWQRNMGSAVTGLLTADVAGDDTPEVVVGTEDGSVHVITATETLGVFKAGGLITHIAAADLDGDG
ncbi:MAG TPA: hypothetical protein QGH10_08435, partial [Armatimonadota bacterium]|nr:hypothetical protein [Armatimonadota bacterium]